MQIYSHVSFIADDLGKYITTIELEKMFRGKR